MKAVRKTLADKIVVDHRTDLIKHPYFMLQEIRELDAISKASYFFVVWILHPTDYFIWGKLSSSGPLRDHIHYQHHLSQFSIYIQLPRPLSALVYSLSA